MCFRLINPDDFAKALSQVTLVISRVFGEIIQGFCSDYTLSWAKLSRQVSLDAQMEPNLSK